MTPNEAIDYHQGLVGYLTERFDEAVELAECASLGREYLPNLVSQRLKDLRNCSTILWRKGLFEAANQGKDVFLDHYLPGSIQEPVPQLWIFESSQRIRSGPWGGLRIHAIFTYSGVSKDPSSPAITQGIWSTFVCSDPDNHPLDHRPRLRFAGAQPVPWKVMEPYNSIAAGLLFLDQEFVGMERHKREPQGKTRAERRFDHYQHRHASDVSVVTLRRSFRGEKASGRGDCREHSCSWLVSAHWRRQWMPSKGTWEPRYILPHLKGDPTKPLRQPRGLVYSVSR